MCASLLALWLFSANSFCIGQQPPPKQDAPIVEGKVCDVNGAVLVGATLRLAPEGSDSLAAARTQVSATSDQTGKYLLVAPAAGRYVLDVAANGFATLVINGIALARGETRQMDLVLQIEPFEGHLAQPRLRAKSEAPPVEFSDSPSFTVAGITDRSNMGLHGSDANVRTSDALAKDTATLKSAPTASASPSSSEAVWHRSVGDDKEKGGDPVGAEREYEAAVRLEPSEENYFAWGAELLLHHAGPAALQVFAKGADLHPFSARLHMGLAAAYYSDGQYAEAASQVCKASDLNPEDPQPYLFLGKMQKAAADPLPCSEERLARFARAQPQDALANVYYGLVLWKKLRKTGGARGYPAEEYFRKAVIDDDRFGEAWLQLGLLHNARGDKHLALAELQKAVEVSPDLSDAHYQLSLAFRRAGDTTKADAEMKKYDELRRQEDAQLEKERRELRQFVTILKDNSAPR